MGMIYRNMGVSPIPEDRHQSKIKIVSVVYSQNGPKDLSSFTPIFTGCKSARTGGVRGKLRIF